MERILDLMAHRFPPPHMAGLALRMVPDPVRQRALARVLNHHLQTLASEEELELLNGKVLEVRISDVNLGWWLTVTNSRLVDVRPGTSADAIISGRLGDVLMLAGRLEDPDTLFFERRLEVSGDTATGLLLRNLLDRMPADALPLPQRIVLNRLARFSARLRRLRSL